MIDGTAYDLGWLAGILDGEGCITITRQRPGTDGRLNWSYRLYVKIAMCHRPSVQRVRDLTGFGSITVQRSPRFSTAYVWWSANREAISFLNAVRPHLVTKAKEADIALRWGALPLAPRGGRGGGQPVPKKLLAARHRLFEQLRDAKPSARFRRTNAKDQVQ